jgi:hypothetical protein
MGCGKTCGRIGDIQSGSGIEDGESVGLGSGGSEGLETTTADFRGRAGQTSETEVETWSEHARGAGLRIVRLVRRTELQSAVGGEESVGKSENQPCYLWGLSGP